MFLKEGFLAPSGAQEVTMQCVFVPSSVGSVHVCLEPSIFIILAQVSLSSPTFLGRTDGA